LPPSIVKIEHRIENILLEGGPSQDFSIISPLKSLPAFNVEFESAVEREVQHMTEESSVTVGDEGDHARDTLVAEEGGR
jgi:hypothetical protein